MSSILSHSSALSYSSMYEFNHHDIHSSCPEKIILCIDLAEDVSTTTANSKKRGDLSLLTVWKSALEMFIHNKNMISKKHEFAIVVLQDNAQWFCDFNSNPQDVCKVICDLQSVGENYDAFDTSSLYSIIYENCPPPPNTDNPLLPPPFVVRAILLYGRSHCMPVHKGDVKAHDMLFESPYFFFDILYAHAPPSPGNLCKSIYEILVELNTRPKALVLDWSFSVTQLFNCFAKLLSHPLQRPIQLNMEHKLV